MVNNVINWSGICYIIIFIGVFLVDVYLGWFWMIVVFLIIYFLVCIRFFFDYKIVNSILGLIILIEFWFKEFCGCKFVFDGVNWVEFFVGYGVIDIVCSIFFFEIFIRRGCCGKFNIIGCILFCVLFYCIWYGWN